MGFSDVKERLGGRHTQCPSVKRHQGDKASGPIDAIGMSEVTSQNFTVTDRLFEILFLISALDDHPLPEQPEELL